VKGGSRKSHLAARKGWPFQKRGKDVKREKWRGKKAGSIVAGGQSEEAAPPRNDKGGRIPRNLLTGGSLSKPTWSGQRGGTKRRNGEEKFALVLVNKTQSPGGVGLKLPRREEGEKYSKKGQGKKWNCWPNCRGAGLERALGAMRAVKSQGSRS